MNVGKSHRDAFDHSEMHQRISNFQSGTPFANPSACQGIVRAISENHEFASVTAWRKFGGT
jgi:hypothetical protein